MRRRASGLWAHLVLWPALLVSTTLVLPASHSAALRGASGPTKAPRTPDGRDEGWSWTENLWAQLVGTPNGPSVLRLEDYQNCVAEVQDQLHQLRLKSRPFTLDQAQNAASLYGAGRMEYQREHASLDIRKLCGVISFDEDMSSGTALVNVGAKTDFKSLTRFLLKRGFIPPVVPEVDTVTVGGAISGLVMESSSFRYGFLHNAVKSMDVLLPNGTVVPCSRQRNMELFRAIPHSYGTLGYVLSATLTAVAAQQELQVTVLEFPSIEQAVEKISDMSRSRSVDFVDGIIYSQDRALAIFASMQPPEALEALDTVVMPDDGRFIDVLGQKLRESEEAGRRKIAFKMSTFDYLYRWDCDIFWSTRRVDALGQPEVRRILGRGFLRSKILWAVGSRVRDAKEWVSQAMWQLLGDRGAAFGFRPPTERIIQDLGVRFDQVPSFAKGLEAHGELPFWMCPVRVVPGEQPLFPLPDVPHIMDVACFGAVPCGDEELYHNKGIDRLLEEFDGQKAFYSDVTFSREYLYKKYNGAEYDQLKAKLDPDGVLPHLYDKVLAVPAPSTRG